MAKQARPLSPQAEKVLETLRNDFPNGATLSEIKTVMSNANPSHLRALADRNLVETELVEIETVRVVKSKVNRYFVVETDNDESDETETDTDE